MLESFNYCTNKKNAGDVGFEPTASGWKNDYKPWALTLTPSRRNTEKNSKINGL